MASICAFAAIPGNVSLFASSCQAQVVPGPLDLDHKSATALYKAAVRNVSLRSAKGNYSATEVRYATIASSDAWAEYRRRIARTDPTVLDAAPASQRIAWWMNTYHAILLTEIAAGLPASAPAPGNLPPQSPLRIADLMTKPVAAARSSTSLEDIREKIAKLGDYRAVLLLHDGTVGGPAIAGSLDGSQPEPMQQFMVDNQLRAALRRWCASATNVRLDTGRNVLTLSSALRDTSELSRSWVLPSAPVADRYSSQDAMALRMIWPGLTQTDREFMARRTPKIQYATPDQTLNIIN